MAYLDAVKAASEIWHETMNRRLDASDHAFEITDSSGCLLIELPFVEALAASVLESRLPPLSSRRSAPSRTSDTMMRSAVLAGEIATCITTVRDTMEQTRRLLRRARTASQAGFR